VLELDDVRFGYEARRVIDGVTVTVERGEVLAVVGPNSAGKTTLVRLISKVLVPSRGAVRLDGVDVGRLGRVDVARTIAVVPQEVALAFPFTVLEFVLSGRYPHATTGFFDGPDGLRLAREALDTVGVADLGERLVTALSGGERQLVLVARALAQRPRLLVMDEANAHLDLRHQVNLARLIRRLPRQEGTAIVFVSHDLNLASQLADRILVLADGRVAGLGTPDAVLEADRLEAVYGCPVRVVRDTATGRPRVEIEWLAGAREAR
jgi:iron complex transport system ATP-binding protein